MRILLLGATDLTIALLNAMVASGHRPVGVVSIGNTFSISYSTQVVNARHVDMEGYCAAQSIPHFAYARDNEALMAFAQKHQAQLCVVAGWYFMLPERFREMFTHGCIGIHASLLPALRGAAPLNWAIVKGLTHTGVSIFEIGAGMDEGRIYAQEVIAVEPRENVTSLVKKVEAVSVPLMLKTIQAIAEDKASPYEQSGVVSYACPREPKDAQIDWSQSAETIDRLIRASTRPYAGAYCAVKDRTMHIWAAEPFTACVVWGRPGQVCRIGSTQEPVVVCGTGALRILQASDSGGEDMLPVLRSLNYVTLG